MISAFFNIFKILFSMLKYPFYFLLGSFCVFFFSICVNIVFQLAKGKRFPKNEGTKPKKKGILRRLFIDVPHQFVLDLLEREPDFFPYQGLIIFEGRQGAGKTISMVEFATRMKNERLKSKMISNMSLKGEDANLKDWRMLIDYKNGHHGVIVVMDELQNWFSSNDSRNFPPEMLGVITQNRKNRRIILGTSQNFYLLAKAIRSQATEVRRCTTLLGCLTIVRRFEPILDSEGNVVEFKKRGMYFFVHDKKLRESYDTYKVIENLKKSGFKEQTIVDNTTYLNLAVAPLKAKK